MFNILLQLDDTSALCNVSMRRATESNQNGIRYVHNVHCSENHYNETILPIIMIRCIGMCLL